MGTSFVFPKFIFAIVYTHKTMKDIIKQYAENRTTILLVLLGFYVIYNLSYSVGEMYYFFSN